jgi:8-oxo-dGTP pyrophosphatase MutT (NUDIX family)
MFNNKPKEIELINEGLIPSILSHQEMLKMGATGALSRAFERYILLDKIEGLDPEPSTWGDGYEFKKGEEIKSSIEVIYDKDRDIYFLQNGNHRIKQARVNGDKYIRAFIQPDNGKIGNDAKLSISESLNETRLNEGYEEIKDINELANDIIYSLSYKLNATKTPSKSNPGTYLYEFNKAITTIEESINFQKTVKYQNFTSNNFKNFCDKFKNISITFEKGSKDNEGRYNLNTKSIILFITDEKELEINQDLNIDNKVTTTKDIYFKIHGKFISILEHELQHVYDDYISKGQAFNVKQTKHEYDYTQFDDAKEYLNLPYEVNARFTQAINKINFLELVDFTDDNKQIERPYEFKKVLRDFLYQFPHKHLLNQNVKNTVIKRLYNIYNKAIEKAKTDDKIELIKENNLDYTTTDDKNNVLIYVDGNKILNKLKTDSPEFDITNKDNQIGNRVEKAKEFISNYKTDKRPIHPTTGERIDYLGKHSFEPSVASFDMNGKLGFTDGRHRILAAIESGINKVGVLVPKNQVDMFKDLINESNSQLEDTFIKINSPNIKSHIDSLINKYSEKSEVMNYIKHADEESNKPEYSISYTYCKKLISLATNLKDKHGLDKDKFELYGGFPLINYLSKELNNKREIISRSKKIKTMAGFNHQYNKEHERVGLIKNGKKYVDRNLRECIELIKESEVKVNKEASCIVLLNEDKKILLLKRSDKTPWEPGKWSLVGGKIDLGENAKEAAIRECGEETGLGIKGNKLIYCFTMKEDDYEVNFFIGVSEGSDVRLNGEHTEYKWVNPNEIPELETVPNLLGEIKKCFETLNENKEETVINEEFNKTEYLKWKRNNVTYRGIKELGQDNNVYGSFGKGLYTVPASNKVMAKTFGKLYFVVNGIPKNPKVVNSLNDAEMFRYNLINEYCKQHNNIKSDGFFDDNTSMEAEMLKLGYDGFVIKGREMVNYKPENDKVKYFSNENQLIQYYENFIENNNSVIN